MGLPLHPLLLLAIGLLGAAEEPLLVGRCQDWRALLAEPLLVVGDGIPVRLGVDREVALVGGAVTLYAAIDMGDAQDRTAWSLGSEALGPLTVHVEGPAEEKEPQLEAVQDRLERADQDGIALFAWTCLLDAPGTWRFRLVDAQERQVALARVEVSAGDAPPPWTRLLELDGPILAGWAGEAAVARLPVGPGLPAHPAPPDDCEPWTFLPRGLIDRLGPRTDTGLPMADPVRTDLPARLRRGWIDITLPASACWGLDQVSDHLLARWWLDGSPWIPDADLLEQEARLLDQQIDRTEGSDLRLSLALDWGDLPSGSRVAVQLIWCAEPVRDDLDSCSCMAVHCQEFMEAGAATGIHQPVMMSERLELVAP